MTNDLFALLWSRRQNALHVEPLERTLSLNRTAYRDNQPINDYHPIYVGTQDECLKTADAVRSTIASREKPIHWREAA